MTTEVRLNILLAPATIRPQWRRDYFNDFPGGPETLLRWMATQLGLPVPAFHNADRITEYAAALDTLGASAISESMATDRWATATELLARRDELLLAGWDEMDTEGLPEIVRDLARAVAGRTFVFSSEAARLQRILDAINVGQTLPPHCCYLFDKQENGPVVWRNVRAKLNISSAPEHAPEGPKDSALHKPQTV